MRTNGQPGRYMSLADYLAWEEDNVIKHEYVAGVAYAMSGVTSRHNLITLNLVSALRPIARRRGCRVFATDVKLQAATDRMYYPDVFLVCGQAASFELIADAPSVIVEVTSRSTGRTDHGEKLDAYTRMPSLRAYLIVDQRRQHVVVHARDVDGSWSRKEILAGGEVPIACLDATIAMDDIYDDVPLPPLGVGEEEDELDEWEAED